MQPERHLKALELDKILALCAELAVCDESKKRILEIQPTSDYNEAVRLSGLTDAANILSIRFGNPGIYSVKPCEDMIGRASRGATLSLSDLLKIATILKGARVLEKWYKDAADGSTALDTIFQALTPLPTLEKDITESIISDDEISNNASAELSNIRRKILGANQKARDTLEKMTRSSTYQKFLQDPIVTIRNGRFCLPVKIEYRSEVKGLVHDTSASGSTLFIEPMAVVELNNQIKELEISQQKEIDRILKAFSEDVAANGDIILSNYNSILYIDIIFAKSKFGDKISGVTPTLVKKGETKLDQARHPLISKDNVVPIDIRVGGEFDTLVVTGPNTGGKTVALKTLGLLTLMASCGLMIPAASRSEVCLYEKILADIGDEQSIEQSLSTFSGHMTNIVSILKKADENSLILIDELGAGTDPVEGAALAVSIIAQLREQKSTIVATTHYSEMKMYALETEGVENASCEFDVATLRPTYRLLIGTPGRSNAFAISKRLGLSQSIIDNAQELISSEHLKFEDVVTDLETTRQELEQERRQAQSLRQQAAQSKKDAEEEFQILEKEKEKIIEEAHSRAQSLLARVRFQSDMIMEELEELKKQKDKESFSTDFTSAQSRLRGMMDEMDNTANPVLERKPSGYKLPRKLKVGDVVFLSDFNTEGTVSSLPDNKGYITVQAGILTTSVPVSTVRLLEGKSERVTLNGGAVRTKRASKPKSNTTSGVGKLDLRGLDSQEASMELGRFIDSSALSGLKTLTIVHGKGTGVLREMVQQNLRTNRLVDNYRLGEYGEGGDGVTIVELK